MFRSQRPKSIFLLRMSAAFIFILVVFLSWVPSFSNLKKNTGVVSNAQYTTRQFQSEFTLSSGKVLTCRGKLGSFGGQTCPQWHLERVFQTQEELIIWYNEDHVWQVEDKNHDLLINHSQIYQTHMIFIAFAALLLFGMAIFANKLVRRE